MLFTVGVDCMRHLWYKFLEEPEKWMRQYRSEQDIMGDWLPEQPVFPKDWMIKLGSIVRHKLKGIPKSCIIVTGQPATGEFRKTQEIPWFEPMARPA
jgi:hypothetical protein